MNISIITSNHLRHKAFAKRLCDILSIKTVVCESKKRSTKQFHEKEKDYYKEVEEWSPYNRFVVCAEGAVNGEVIEGILKKDKLDYLFIFGCSLLKKNIFSIPKKGCINIHTGLVQSFRGVDSSLWAIYEEKPEAIGATIHFVNNSIDGGNIIAQSRTELDMEDDLHDIFFKTCNTGFQLLEEKVFDILAGRTRQKKLTKKGKLYQKKDLTKQVVEEVVQKTPDVIRKYLQNKEKIDLGLRLIK
tara:strand:+ start:136 stop:867 length:732 start_codon:yes stop_codon:yes gene_type:complete